MLEHERYRELYYPMIKTPILHTIGLLDCHISESQTMKLVERCSNASIYYFFGTHYVPREKGFVSVLVEFLSTTLGWAKQFENSDSTTTSVS